METRDPTPLSKTLRHWHSAWRNRAPCRHHGVTRPSSTGYVLTAVYSPIFMWICYYLIGLSLLRVPSDCCRHWEIDLRSFAIRLSQRTNVVEVWQNSSNPEPWSTFQYPPAARLESEICAYPLLRTLLSSSYLLCSRDHFGTTGMGCWREALGKLEILHFIIMIFMCFFKYLIYCLFINIH